MSEQERIADQYSRLFNGDSWIDVNIMDTLASLSHKQAAAKPFREANSIWQIVNHLVSWRETVVKRIKGENIPSPEHNFFLPVADTSEAAWEKTITDFETSQQAWLTALKVMTPGEVEQVYTPRNQTNYELIMGILQHDAYHLGQIVILKKFV